MNNRKSWQCLLPLVLCLLPLSAGAGQSDQGDENLFFDQSPAPLGTLQFKRDRDLLPEPSDFRIVQASFLSNEHGERWALITFENQSTGQRLLKNEAIVATFANGFQAHSYNLDITLKGGEVVTKSVSFGVRRFPIVNVETR